MIRLAERTYEEAARLARDPKTVIVFSLGAIEEHGPHIPLLVDWLGAEELARVNSRPTCGARAGDSCPCRRCPTARARSPKIGAARHLPVLVKPLEEGADQWSASSEN